MSTQEPTEEQLREAFERLQVEDVLLQTAASLVNLAGYRLLEKHDLPQARLAIDAVRALLPLCSEQDAAPITEALSQLQMLYVREARGEGGEAEPEPGTPEPQAGAPAEEREDEERAKARSKIWTPPGT